ncbi:MAG TPA: NAD(P)-dependent alcohol dehydrogenase [Acidobacteriaceae bacterium]|nr:NAD(P)-dependent alcohol dehydrogenase [Acidobacteriaceae bacterium]
MRACQISKFGLDNLRLVDLPTPACGDGMVLIRVHATSLNYRDLLMVRGHYDPKLKMPRIPLSDGAGEVAAVGTGVTRFKPGDRVVGLFLQNWQDGGPSQTKSRGALGGDIDGMLAEYVTLPEHGVAHFPVHLSYEEAATLPCAALTAWNTLFHVGATKPGDTVVIQGTGGVSIFALQFAKLVGARVLGTSSSDEKLERAKTLGLDEGLNYKSTPEWSSWVKKQTSGEGADIIVEVGGAGTLNESMKAVRVGGTIAQIGVLSGTEERLAVTSVLMRQIRLIGVYVGSHTMMQAMNRAMELSHMKPVVGKVFPILETVEAYRYLEQGRHFGKVVISLASDK